MRMIRQGDVLLVRLSALPADAQRRPEALAVISGENGHRHVVSGARLFEDLTGRAFAVVNPGATAVLDHDEHPRVVIPEGVWEIRTPRVFDWPSTVEDRTVTRREERSVPYDD